MYGASTWYNNRDNTAPSSATEDNQTAYWYPVGSGAAATNIFGIGYSQPFVAIASPPGTIENDVTLSTPVPPPFNASNLVNPTGPKPTWVHNAQPLVTNIVFDAWGVGDSGATPGTPLNPLGYDPSWMWYGIRVNVEGAYAVGPNIVFTNLQTMLIVNGNQLYTAQSSSKAKPPLLALEYTSATQLKDEVGRIQAMLTSPVLPQALKARKVRMDAMRTVLDKHRQ